MFIVRNCTRIRKLALRMINELVEKNEVYNAEKIDDKWAQRLRIYYNCVGGVGGMKTFPASRTLPVLAVIRYMDSIIFA